MVALNDARHDPGTSPIRIAVYRATRVEPAGQPAKTGQIQYRTNKGVPHCLDALGWNALVTPHIPDRHPQIHNSYGRYSNASCDKRRKQCHPPRTTAGDSSPQPHSPAWHFACQRRRNWVRLLKKIHEVDPLTCPRCGRWRETNAFIEEWTVIRKILQHFGLWGQPQRAPPPALLPHKLEAFPAPLSPGKNNNLGPPPIPSFGRMFPSTTAESRDSSAPVDIAASAFDPDYG